MLVEDDAKLSAGLTARAAAGLRSDPEIAPQARQSPRGWQQVFGHLGLRQRNRGDDLWSLRLCGLFCCQPPSSHRIDHRPHPHAALLQHRVGDRLDNGPQHLDHIVDLTIARCEDRTITTVSTYRSTNFPWWKRWITYLRRLGETGRRM